MSAFGAISFTSGSFAASVGLSFGHSARGGSNRASSSGGAPASAHARQRQPGSTGGYSRGNSIGVFASGAGVGIHLRSGTGLSASLSVSSGAIQARRASSQLSPMSAYAGSTRTNALTPMQSLSTAGQGAQSHKGAKMPSLSSMIRKGFDAFNAAKDSYADAAGHSSPAGKSSAFSKQQLAPLRAHFSDNKDRAARQEAFVDAYMPHLKGLSAIQSGITSVARGMLGIPDKPRKSTAKPPGFSDDLGKIERTSSHKEGMPAMDRHQQERTKTEAFIRTHIPALSPLIKMQNGLESSFRSLLGLPTKRPDQPNMGQKIERTRPANEERENRSPIERHLSQDPDRAARQQAFLNKYMPHVAALSKLQSTLESSVRDAIKGPKNSAVSERGGVGATQ